VTAEDWFNLSVMWAKARNRAYPGSDQWHTYDDMATHCSGISAEYQRRERDDE